MIGFSCPPLCVRPFQESAELILPHFELWEIVSEAEHAVQRIESQMKELLETTHMRLSVHAPYSDINLAAFDPRARKHSVETLSEIIGICGRLGIGPITVHPGVIGPIQRYDRDKVRALTRAGLETLALEAQDCGVKVALENMPDMKACICKTADEMENMLEGLEMGMCFDIGHANTMKQIPDLLKLQKRFLNMHVHDNLGQNDQHLQPGKGNIDFGVLKGLNYRGNHVIEAATADMAEAVVSRNFFLELLE